MLWVAPPVAAGLAYPLGFLDRRGRPRSAMTADTGAPKGQSGAAARAPAVMGGRSSAVVFLAITFGVTLDLDILLSVSP